MFSPALVRLFVRLSEITQKVMDRFSGHVGFVTNSISLYFGGAVATSARAAAHRDPAQTPTGT